MPGCYCRWRGGSPQCQGAGTVGVGVIPQCLGEIAIGLGGLPQCLGGAAVGVGGMPQCLGGAAVGGGTNANRKGTIAVEVAVPRLSPAMGGFAFAICGERLATSRPMLPSCPSTAQLAKSVCADRLQRRLRLLRRCGLERR